jgi:hypothetical protein
MPLSLLHCDVSPFIVATGIYTTPASVVSWFMAEFVANWEAFIVYATRAKNMLHKTRKL